MTPMLPRGLVALVLFLLPFAAAGQGKASDIPIEQFFRRADYQGMQLSPKGDRLAATIPYKGRANMVVIDLNKRSRSVISSFESMDVGAFNWVNNDRLCMRVAETQDVTGAFNYRGTYCVDHDGQNLRDFTRLGTRMNFLAPLDDGSQDILAVFPERSRDSLDAYRLNTRTGAHEILTRDSPGDVSSYVADRNGVIRIAVSDPERKSKSDLVKRSIWHRDSNSAKWEKIFEFDTIAGRAYAGGVQPLAFDYDNTTLYLASNIGRDKAAIYKYDTKARKLGELLFEHPLIDVTGGLLFHRGQKKLLGIRFQADRPVTRWVDDDLNRIQQAVDATFKTTSNQIILPADSTDRALILGSSDVHPGIYYLFDRKANGVEELAKQRDWIDPALMSERRFFTYKARDGREIPAYVTIPKGSSGKNLPLIVHVHGGPAVRGYFHQSWGRWPDAQFLASRGYAVLEPEPRGSTGFGQDHWKAGWKQWGLAAQDDLDDGALHLVKEGIADRDRICMMGGSYGGYTSAMAAVRENPIYRCTAPYVAVTDLFLLQSVTYSDTAQLSDYLDTDFLRVVGDPRADREQFMRTSPARLGERAKIPVFLAMGSRDVRVPEVHGAEFYKSVTKGGAKIEYKVYNGEGHGFNKDENVYDFYRTLEKFFAENLKK